MALMRAIVHWQQHKILRILAAGTINSGDVKLRNLPRQHLSYL